MFTRFSPNIYFVFVTKTIMTVGNFVYPFLTLYLTERLGLNAFSAGLVIMTTTVGCVGGSIIGGIFADRFDRKNTVVVMLCISGLCYIIVPLFCAPVMIIILLGCSLGLLAASEPALNALISNITDDTNRKSAYSFIYWGTNIGYAVGPLIAGLLYTNHTKLLFVGDGVATIAAAALLLAGVKAPLGIKDAERDEVPAGFRQENGLPAKKIQYGFAAAIIANPTVVAFCLFFTAHSFVYSQTTFAVPLFVEKHFANGPTLYGLLMTINGVAVVALTPLLVFLSKRTSSLTSVAVGIGIYSIAFGIFSFSHALPIVILAVIAWSCGEILCVPNAKTFIAESTQNCYRGRFNTLLDIAFEIGFGTGPALTGKMIVLRGLPFVWPVLSLISFCIAFAILLLRKIYKPQSSDNRSSLEGTTHHHADRDDL